MRRQCQSLAEITPAALQPGIRAVLFDAVGTLIAPYPSVAEAYHVAGQRFGSFLPAESIRWRFRDALKSQEILDAQQIPPHATCEERELTRWRSIVTEVFDDISDSEPLFQSLWDHFAQPQHWRLYDDVAGCWARLTQAGLTVGIASNFDSRLDGIRAAYPLLASCPCFVSSRIGHKKPSPAFFRAIEQSLALPPEQILLVGDDFDNDYLAAQAAGWHALLITRP
jgi:putative hydrolase of the HAD superfamily